VLQICQRSSIKLEQVTRKQDKLEAMINEQKDKISEISSKLDQFQNTNSEIKDKNKDKGKKNKDYKFYQVNICFIYCTIVFTVF
jgi:septal ring factor EnvC (AmiA/AmiB activator)